MASPKNRNKGKHYTPAEKSFFVQILHKYKHIIECKKSSNNTLREKETAWADICDEFNNSSLITQERNIHQLKKLWTNMKQTQRDIITKEKQNRFATGGRSEIPSVELDPDVAVIAPTLMSTAPTLFSSNMDDKEIQDRQQLVQDSLDKLIDIASSSHIAIETTCAINTNAKKRKISESEDDLKMKRIKNILQQDREFAKAKLSHEERMANIKEAHLIEINNLQIAHLKELQELELRAARARAELSEVLMKKEKNIS